MSKDNSSEQTRLLSEILKWIKFAGIKEVKSTLMSALDSDAKKLIYQKSDGTQGSVELAKLVSIKSNRTVADMWDVWLRLNIGESIPAKGGSRFKRSFDLNDFGIEVPEVKTAENVKEEEKKEVSEQKPEATK
jgi:hypothetical protein